MRVIAGEVRGRRLTAPPGTTVRPTGDRVREATFNALMSMGAVVDAVVVDLFAGSGAMGIEALSRGARHATFVERDRQAVAAIRENLDTCGFTERAEVLQGDATALVDHLPPADLALCDPPYEFDGWIDLLDRLSAQLVVVEAGRAVELPAGWTVLRQKRYRSTVVQMATPPAERGATP